MIEVNQIITLYTLNAYSAVLYVNYIAIKLEEKKIQGFKLLISNLSHSLKSSCFIAVVVSI